MWSDAQVKRNREQSGISRNIKQLQLAGFL